MANLAAPEQNRLLAQLASLLRGREEVQAQMNPTMMGALMDLILPSAQTVEKLSYGDPMFRMPPSGTGGYIPITTDKQYAAELIGMSPAIPAASRATARISNEAADQLVRAITRNPEATAPAVLEAAGQMAPLSRIFRPEQVKSVLPETKVVDEAGNPQIVYHGTPDAFESNIRAESYFTSQPELANMYTNTSASSIATRPKLGEAPAIYPSYLNIKKPFDTRDPKIRKEFMEEYYGKYSRTPLSNRSGLPDWTEGRDLKEWIEESGKKYDGLILDEGGIPMPDGTVMSRGISYVPFKEEQIKSAVSDPSFAGLLEPQTVAPKIVKPGDKVSGLTVREEVPNVSSIPASLDDYEILSGIREVPRGAFDKEYLDSLSFENLDKRTKDLARQIQESKEINPMIVGVDSKGAYIIEGGHRFDALMAQDTKSIPAMVVIDKSDPPSEAILKSLLD